MKLDLQESEEMLHKIHQRKCIYRLNITNKFILKSMLVVLILFIFLLLLSALVFTMVSVY